MIINFQVYGLTGDHSTDFWTPPSCIQTTPEPTTTTPTPPTTFEEEGALEKAVEENEALKEKISGLKQHYAPIGKRVYDALKDSAFHTFESYLAREAVIKEEVIPISISIICFQVLDGGDIGMIEKLAQHPDDPDYAFDNLI